MWSPSHPVHVVSAIEPQALCFLSKPLPTELHRQSLRALVYLLGFSFICLFIIVSICDAVGGSTFGGSTGEGTHVEVRGNSVGPVLSFHIHMGFWGFNLGHPACAANVFIC